MKLYKPMKAEDAAKLHLTREFLCASPLFAGEPKVDGDRCLVHVGEGNVFFASSTGKEARYSAILHRDFLQFRESPARWVFDGELLNGKFYVFDLVEAGTLVEPSMPFVDRREILEGFCERWEHSDAVILMPSYTDAASKIALAALIEQENGEGVMFKRLDAPYYPGKRTEGWVKLKYRKDVDCVVTELGRDGKNNMVLGVFRDDAPNPVIVGDCTALAGDGARVKVGDVVCVRILYVTKKIERGKEVLRLYQPTLPRIRTDKEAAECTWDQLPPLLVNKTVHSL